MSAARTPGRVQTAWYYIPEHWLMYVGYRRVIAVTCAISVGGGHMNWGVGNGSCAARVLSSLDTGP